MTEKIYKARSRVNFSMSTKGVCTPEVTFEGIDMDKFDVLKEAEELLVHAKAVAKEQSIS